MRCAPKRQSAIQFGIFAGLLVVNAGCINLAANLLHAVNGNNRPAEFDGLAGQKVAVICSTDQGFTSNATNSILTNNIHAALSINVEDIELVRHSEIEQWLDVEHSPGLESAITVYSDILAGAYRALDARMNLGHVRAGGIQYLRIFLLDFLPFFGRDSVGANHNMRVFQIL